MAARLGPNNYGKSRVRMLKVRRRAGRHEIVEITADIALEGDFAAAHTAGDNSNVLPTDTMKNTVYALGKDHPLDTIESFALHLADHFLKTVPHVSRAAVSIEETPWERVHVAGGPQPHTFIRVGTERRLCRVGAARGGPPTVESGLDGLVILKSGDSAFSGFLKDRYTTLKETRDRIMATSVSAWWSFGAGQADFAGARTAVRGALIEAFAGHKSESVQHTLHEMGKRALDAAEEVASIRLSLPNKHCLLVDLSPFGLPNENEIFLPIDEPHGLIEATVERG